MTTQQKIDNKRSFELIMQRLERIVNGDSINFPASYVAGQLRYLASELDLLKDIDPNKD